jgi:hypothetical protein
MVHVAETALDGEGKGKGKGKGQRVSMKASVIPSAQEGALRF